MATSDETPPAIGPGRTRQTEIYLRGLGGILPKVPVAAAALEEAAGRAMTRNAFGYVAGGAGMERTMAANRAAFDRHAIVPRMLADASRRDLGVTLFGRTHKLPFLLAPIGVLEMAHREAERAVARAARSEGVGMVFSNQASVAMEEVAGLLGDTPRWFQLYWSTDDELTRSLVGRAEAAGCEAIVLTLDTTILGWRPRDLDLASLPFLRGQGLAQYLTDPVFLKALPAKPPASPIKPSGLDLVTALIDLSSAARRFGLSLSAARAAVARFTAIYSRPDLVWDDVSRLKEMTRLPVVLKGIQSAADASEAVRRGVDGIVVSNHGGRQVDGAIGSLDALPAVVAAAGTTPVLFDSGVRSGADMFKALALGARAVLLGRPYVYGLAVAGQQGVAEVIRNMEAELDITMALTGCRTIADIAGAEMTGR